MNFDENKYLLKGYLIRKVEESLMDLFKKGKLFGTTHTSIGQEMSSVCVTGNLSEDDVIFSNHRCHGHYIARTDDVEGLIAEIMGKSTGVCSGFGGSQHLFNKNFYSNGIQGGIVPVSAGISLSLKRANSSSIMVVFIGDGTLGQGVVYETLNISSKWKLPILFVLENNFYSQSTAQEETLAGSIKKRAEAFDINFFLSDTWHYEDLDGIAKNAIDYVRGNGLPAFLQIDTFRLGPHSKSDDHRDKELISKYSECDPINLFIKNSIESPSLQESFKKIETRIDNAIKKANNADFPQFNSNSPTKKEPIQLKIVQLEKNSQLKAINNALFDQLKKEPKSILIGEDIRAPYGGAFKVTRSISDEFTDQVINSPISEAAIVGIGNGLALKGDFPIIEIMFGDFIGLAFDQIINHSSKFMGMFNQKIKMPLIIRTPMGGGRGYGPTHSQNLEKFLVGIPNVKLFLLHCRTRVEHLYNTLFNNIDYPALVIEHKLLYAVRGNQVLPKFYTAYETDDLFPTTILKSNEKPDITLVAFGGSSLTAEKVAIDLFNKEEIIAEVIYPLQVSPLNVDLILKSVNETKKIVIVEEGTGGFGVGSEVIARITIEWKQNLRFIARNITALPMVIPSSGELEKQMLPSYKKIFDTCIEVFDD